MMDELRTELLTEYAAGTLPEGQAVMIASYLSLGAHVCAEARAHVGLCEQMAGLLLDTHCETACMKDDALKTVLSRLDDAPAAEPAPPPVQHINDALTLPAPLCALLAQHNAPLRWRSLGGGSRIAVLPRAACGARLLAFDIAPGRKMPEHRHKGIELTLVLQGSYHDEDGTYPAGMLAVNADDSAHHPVADARAGCVCITAVQGVTFSGIFARLLNPFWG